MTPAIPAKIFHERVLLLAPLFSIILFVFFNYIVFADSAKAISHQLYLMDYIFINKVHTIVGLLLFFTLFETVKVHNRSPAIVSEFSFVYIAVFVFFLLPHFNWHYFWNNPFYLVPYLFLTKWVPYWHNAFQSHGISLLYSMKAREHLTLPENEKLHRLIQIERAATKFLVVGAFITPDIGYTTLFVHVKMPSYFFPLGIAIQVISLLILMPTSYKISKTISNPKKILFDLRYLIYPMASFSIVAFIAIRVNHGIEYFFTMVHVFKKSETPFKTKKILLWAMPIIAIIYSAIFLGREIEKYLTGQITIIGIIAFNLALTINIIHFHFDSKMFAMKKEKVRRYMGALLLKGS